LAFFFFGVFLFLGVLAVLFVFVFGGVFVVGAGLGAGVVTLRDPGCV